MQTNNTTTPFDENGFWSPPKPRWQDWLRIRHCKLWEAVALACNVDPSVYGPTGLSANVAPDGTLPTIPATLRDLLHSADVAVLSGRLTTSRTSGSDRMQSEVDLADFTTWLQSGRHDPPDGFPWKSRELVAGPNHWPWGTYQTKDLEILALAADRFWKNYDPADKSTAPTNETVAAWLVDKGISTRKAEYIASILRADDLPTGPR